ncbi:Ubiquitin-like-specific protease 1D [Zea mays]|uniref:Ubiquitin-like-specific protease 1D n=1 Tax=Zea mays TaxID=4577 RepID=A0A1D6ND93_MAIZE|nr:Ubiquitin-like-specific protease 1D [Zea mays]
MAAQNAGIIIDCRQAMSPDPPAVELEVIGSSSPSITPCPAAAAPADADFDHDGCTAELSSSTDRELQDHIRQWEGSYGQGVLRRMPDGGEKMHSRVLRMKKELERRRARQRMDVTPLRQTVQAKRTGGSSGEIYNLSLIGYVPYVQLLDISKHRLPTGMFYTSFQGMEYRVCVFVNESDDETMDSTASKHYPNSSCTTSTKTYTQVKGAAYEEQSSLSHGKYAYPKNGGQISKESLRHQSKTWNLAKNKASPLEIKKDVVLLDDDDDIEPARSADVQISNKCTDPEAVELTYSDMKCLEPEEYLKSPVINFYLHFWKLESQKLRKAEKPDFMGFL